MAGAPYSLFLQLFEKSPSKKSDLEETKASGMMSKILKWLHFEVFSHAIIHEKSFDVSLTEDMKHNFINVPAL